METTRHFTATTYVVHDGATALHEHKRHERWLPPGGHVDRGETPAEAARREVREETGLDVTLFGSTADVETDTVRGMLQPHHLMLVDVNVHDGEVGHQHMDFTYFGEVDRRTIAPADGEKAAEHWQWFTAEELRDHDGLTESVVEVGCEAIGVVQSE